MINIVDKREKQLRDVFTISIGDVFEYYNKVTNHYSIFIKTGMDEDNKVRCIDLKSGYTYLFEKSEKVNPVNVTLTIEGDIL